VFYTVILEKGLGLNSVTHGTLNTLNKCAKPTNDAARYTYGPLCRDMLLKNYHMKRSEYQTRI